MTDALIDLRCPQIRVSGPKKGAPCRYLLCRITPDLRGVVETRCHRCNHVRQWAMGGARLDTAVTTHG